MGKFGEQHQITCATRLLFTPAIHCGLILSLELNGKGTAGKKVLLFATVMLETTVTRHVTAKCYLNMPRCKYGEHSMNTCDVFYDFSSSPAKTSVTNRSSQFKTSRMILISNL